MRDFSFAIRRRICRNSALYGLQNERLVTGCNLYVRWSHVLCVRAYDSCPNWCVVMPRMTKSGVGWRQAFFWGMFLIKWCEFGYWRTGLSWAILSNMLVEKNKLTNGQKGEFRQFFRHFVWIIICCLCVMIEVPDISQYHVRPYRHVKLIGSVLRPIGFCKQVIGNMNLLSVLCYRCRCPISFCGGLLIITLMLKEMFYSFGIRS